jgi:hypothetical protein
MGSKEHTEKVIMYGSIVVLDILSKSQDRVFSIGSQHTEWVLTCDLGPYSFSS